MKNRSIPKIAIISDSRFPSAATDTQQVVKNLNALLEAGADAEIIAPYIFKNMFTGNRKVAEKLCAFYNIKGDIRIRQLRLLPAINLAFFKVLHGILATLYCLIKGYDIIYSRNPLAAVLSLLCRKRVIFETYRKLGDDYPGLVKKLAKLARKPFFLGIITHSEVSRKSIIRGGFPADKVKTFHNGYDPNDLQPVLNKRAARKELGLKPGGRCIVYTGNMQANKGLDYVIDIAASMKNTTFLLVGGLPEHLKELHQLATAKGISNIVFTGHQPISRLSYYLYAADILLIPPTAIPLQRYGRTVLPMKTFLYLGAGRPILAGKLPDVGELLKHNRNACLVEPDNLQKAVSTIEHLFHDDAYAKKISTGALKTAANLTWTARGKKIRTWINQQYARSTK